MRKAPFWLGLLLLTACGAPAEESKVALALQTLMANILEAYATKTGDETVITLACGDRSGNQGQLTYDPGSAIPTDPIELVNSAGQAANVPLVLEACQIQVCGETYVLESDGTQAQLNMGRVDELIGTVSEGQVPARIVLSATDLAVSGSLSTTWTFRYSLQGIFDRTTLSDLILGDGDPVQRLTVEGVEIRGDEINALADGC